MSTARRISPEALDGPRERPAPPRILASQQTIRFRHVQVENATQRAPRPADIQHVLNHTVPTHVTMLRSTPKDAA